MRALVLGGGGSKGAYQAGVIEHLLRSEKLEYDIICGTSVGAINAAFLAQFPKEMSQDSAGKLQQMWSSVTTKKVRKNWFPLGVLEALWKPSVYNSKPVQDWVRSEIKSALIKKSGRQLRVVAVSWSTGEVAVADENHPDIAEWVLASSAFPVMLTPIEINGDLWTDGGLRNVTPLGEAIRAGADEIDVVMCSDPFAPSSFNAKGAHAIPQLLLRAVDVLSDQVSRADLQICGLKNDLALLPGSPFRNVKVRIFQPKTPLPFDSLDFSPENIEKMYAMGLVDGSICKTI